MQFIYTSSSESTNSSGLDLVSGRVTHFNDHIKSKKTPNIGFRNVCFRGSLEYLTSTEDTFYFVHSYCNADVSDVSVLATSSYDDFEFVAAVGYKNYIGLQFHPEISGCSGVKFLRELIKSMLD